ncbi:hypothetical protein HYS94_01900 [Candidatus Daviesbacteria bacterium]|nr:hypothetical protein [Candidatus Daviesbacteria bacterium]
MQRNNEILDSTYSLLSEAKNALFMSFKNLDRRNLSVVCECLYRAETLIEQAREKLEEDNNDDTDK